MRSIIAAWIAIFQDWNCFCSSVSCAQGSGCSSSPSPKIPGQSFFQYLGVNAESIGAVWQSTMPMAFIFLERSDCKVFHPSW